MCLCCCVSNVFSESGAGALVVAIRESDKFVVVVVSVSTSCSLCTVLLKTGILRWFGHVKLKYNAF